MLRTPATTWYEYALAMVGIPPAFDTDAEDVAWALQTADTLWKREERVDAIVWLRRAAQAAGDAEDDDRALALAREAAELADWVAHNVPAVASAQSIPPALEAPTRGAEAVDDLLRRARAEPVEDAPSPDSTDPLIPLTTHVPTAAEAHAGMLDPWADTEGPAPGDQPAQGGRSPPVSPAAPRGFDYEEVVTSAPPMAKARPLVRRASPRPPARSLPPPAPTTPPERWATGPSSGVDLSNVEAFSDLPEPDRDAFARAAVVRELAREEEVSGFALALVLEGSVDVAATIVDAAAQRLEAGAVLRSRGTVAQVVPVRLVAASERAYVATWDERALTDALRTFPWVEDELRTASDRFQALVGLTMGALGERLDPALRADVTRKLRLHTLAEHEVFATRGTPIPGLLVVGAGELELLGDDGIPNGTVVRPGEFLFANEVLRAAPAPNTVRAAKGGALVLLADRGVAQELLVTCPPLLEIFAGM